MMAPSSVNNGPVARSGAAMERGSLRKAMKESVQDAVTMDVLAIIRRWPRRPRDSTVQPRCEARDGANSVSPKGGKTRAHADAEHRNRVGNSALLSTADFLPTS